MDKEKLIIIGTGAIAGVLGYEIIKKLLDTTFDSLTYRKRVVNTILQHPEINGFESLGVWLQRDGFLDEGGQFKPENIDPPPSFTIGQGRGATKIDNTMEWLKTLTAPKLEFVVEKAIIWNKKQGQNTQQDRQEVMDNMITKNIAIVGFPQWKDLLSKGGFLTVDGQMTVPPNAPISLKLGSHNPLSVRVSQAVGEATANSVTAIVQEVLKRNGVPDDKGYVTRINNMNILTETNKDKGGIVGFVKLANWLHSAKYDVSPWAFITDPLKWTPPANITDDSTIILGSDDPINVMKLINNLRSDGSYLQSYLPAVVKRYNPVKANRRMAVAKLVAVSQIPDSIGSLELAKYLDVSNWIDGPENVDISKVPNKIIIVGGYGTTLVNLHNFIPTATVDDILAIVNLSTDKSRGYYQRYLMIQKLRSIAHLVGFTKDSSGYITDKNQEPNGDLNKFCDWLVAHGYLLAPGAKYVFPKQDPQPPPPVTVQIPYWQGVRQAGQITTNWIFGSKKIHTPASSNAPVQTWYYYPNDWAFATGDTRPLMSMIHAVWDIIPNPSSPFNPNIKLHTINEQDPNNWVAGMSTKSLPAKASLSYPSFDNDIYIQWQNWLPKDAKYPPFS